MSNPCFLLVEMNAAAFVKQDTVVIPATERPTH
jgi:hypothetical protein